MNGFSDLLLDMGLMPCKENDKYCKAGKSFCACDNFMDGIYWFYETDYFIVNIHDFFIKNQLIKNDFPDMRRHMMFSSTYIKSANGECFSPYQPLTSNSVFISNVETANFRFLLHSNYPYLSVGVNFKKKMIEDYLDCHLCTHDASASDIFLDTRDMITKPLEKLANSILACKMESPAAEIFLEAKAKEWLSITLQAYLSKSKTKKISPSDDKIIENVANYINDHYALDITQELLEKIAMMSGTKLKTIFKQKYNMSITEYIQRRRMNIAEILLSTTMLDIKTIANSVGYASHSRFTTLFKKFKGIYPREIRKFSDFSKDKSPVCTCLNKHN